MALIEREALLAEINKWTESVMYKDWVQSAIAYSPAIAAAPVVHGRWEFPVFTDEDNGLDPRVKCSECGGIEAAFARWKYCPNCGARMDGGEGHEAN